MLSNLSDLTIGILKMVIDVPKEAVFERSLNVALLVDLDLSAADNPGENFKLAPKLAGLGLAEISFEACEGAGHVPKILASINVARYSSPTAEDNHYTDDCADCL